MVGQPPVRRSPKTLPLYLAAALILTYLILALALTLTLALAQSTVAR